MQNLHRRFNNGCQAMAMVTILMIIMINKQDAKVVVKKQISSPGPDFGPNAPDPTNCSNPGQTSSGGLVGNHGQEDVRQCET